MLTVLPSINCHSGDDACMRDKLAKVGKFAGWIHLDVADGTVTFNRTWNSPEIWKSISRKPKLEVHLMVSDVLGILPAWLAAGAKRVVIQFEYSDKRTFEKIRDLCRASGAEVVLSILPETPVSLLEEYHTLLKCYQIFSQADLGPSGQKFLPTVLPKIRELRKKFPDAYIEIDGGMNYDAARSAVRSGANAIVSGSYIFNSSDPEKSYRLLLSLGKTKVF